MVPQRHGHNAELLSEILEVRIIVERVEEIKDGVEAKFVLLLEVEVKEYSEINVVYCVECRDKNLNLKQSLMFLSDEGPTLETLDFAFRLSTVYQPFIFRLLKKTLSDGRCYNAEFSAKKNKHAMLHFSKYFWRNKVNLLVY